MKDLESRLCACRRWVLISYHGWREGVDFVLRTLSLGTALEEKSYYYGRDCLMGGGRFQSGWRHLQRWKVEREIKGECCSLSFSGESGRALTWLGASHVCSPFGVDPALEPFLVKSTWHPQLIGLRSRTSFCRLQRARGARNSSLLPILGEGLLM